MTTKKKNGSKDIPEKEYAQFLAEIKNMILESQLKVAPYQAEIMELFPKDFAKDVPTVEEFEAELEKQELSTQKKHKRKTKK